MPLTPSGPLDVLDVLPVERAAFLELLRGLAADDWQRPTECPAYDVQGVTTHILGDDFSLLSRQRDNAVPGLLNVLEAGMDFRSALDRFNDRWVAAAEFFSPALLIDLLELTGQWTEQWYRAVDPASLGEPVGLFGADGPSPYWQISAREYLERWAHHHQIRRALGRTDLDDPAILQPAAAVVVRSLAAHLPDLDASPGDSIVLAVDNLAAWTLARADDGASWGCFEGETGEASAGLRLPLSRATAVLSRGVPGSELADAFTAEGDSGLAGRALGAMAYMVGR